MDIKFREEDKNDDKKVEENWTDRTEYDKNGEPNE